MAFSRIEDVAVAGAVGAGFRFQSRATVAIEMAWRWRWVFFRWLGRSASSPFRRRLCRRAALRRRRWSMDSKASAGKMVSMEVPMKGVWPPGPGVYR